MAVGGGGRDAGGTGVRTADVRTLGAIAKEAETGCIEVELDDDVTHGNRSSPFR